MSGWRPPNLNTACPDLSSGKLQLSKVSHSKRCRGIETSKRGEIWDYSKARGVFYSRFIEIPVLLFMATDMFDFSSKSKFDRQIRPQLAQAQTRGKEVFTRNRALETFIKCKIAGVEYNLMFWELSLETLYFVTPTWRRSWYGFQFGCLKSVLACDFFWWFARNCSQPVC